MQVQAERGRAPQNAELGAAWSRGCLADPAAIVAARAGGDAHPSTRFVSAPRRSMSPPASTDVPIKSMSRRLTKTSTPPRREHCHGTSAVLHCWCSRRNGAVLPLSSSSLLLGNAGARFPLCVGPGPQPVELANSGARLILAPDWRPVIWTEADRKKGQAWGLKRPSRRSIRMEHRRPKERVAKSKESHRRRSSSLRPCKIEPATPQSAHCSSGPAGAAVDVRASGLLYRSRPTRAGGRKLDGGRRSEAPRTARHRL